MFLLLDLIFCAMEWLVESMGCRRINWIMFFVGITSGIACLFSGSPGWAATFFATTTVDAWTLKHGNYGDSDV